jgi:hypothetical protein
LNTEAELLQIKNEVFCEIGKNVASFQLVEHLLKALLRINRMRTTAAGLDNETKERSSKLETKTMGMLVGDFDEAVLKPLEDETGSSNESNEISISISTRLHFENDANAQYEQQAQLKALVDARNDLIHHFVPRRNWKSVADMQAARVELIALRERTEAQRVRLLAVWKACQESLQVMSCFLDSAEGNKHLDLIFLQTNRVVMLLRDIATRSLHKEGWVPIAVAGKEVNATEKAEMLEIKKHHGFRGLTEIIVGAEMFDVMEKPAGAGVCSLYRLRAG